MKRRTNLKIITLVLAMCLVLTSCVTIKTTTTIKADGTGTIYTVNAVTAEYYDILREEFGDAGFSSLTRMTVDGVDCYGTSQTITFNDVSEFNRAFNADEDAVITANLVKDADGIFSLTLEADGNPSDVVLAEYGDVMNDEEVAAFKEGFRSTTIFEFPNAVTQLSGSTAGVTIAGNKLTIDGTQLRRGTYSFFVGDSTSFLDVTGDDWFYEAVRYLARSGIVNGYGGGIFGPRDTLTVDALAAIICRTKGIDITVEPGVYWAAVAVQYCVQAGYINNYGPYTQVNYYRKVTRAEAIAAVEKAFHSNWKTANYDGNIPDVTSIPEEYRQAIIAAYTDGLTSGVDALGTFAPNNILTRAELCQLFYNIRQLWAESDRVRKG